MQGLAVACGEENYFTLVILHPSLSTWKKLSPSTGILVRLLIPFIASNYILQKVLLYAKAWRGIKMGSRKFRRE